jgi:predicted ATPase/DNA-binding SARP family transcriptional activator
VVRIGVLGTLEVRDGSGHPVPVAGPRVRALLVALALDAGRVIPAGTLIDRLWDDPPAGAANALQATVSRLRVALQAAERDGSVVQSHPPGYRLDLPPDAVDALIFTRLAAEGSGALRDGDPALAARRLHHALEFWRGPALADLSGTEYGAAHATRLENIRAAAVLDRVEADLALGDDATLIAELRALASADPLAERPHALLMRALYAAGQQAEALAVYARAKEALADQLGVDPSPELERTHLAILRQQLPGPKVRDHEGESAAAGGSPASARPRTPANPPLRGRLPARLTSFVGRDKDTAQVADQLAAGRLVTLTGPGGVGKTRLAIESAALLAGRMPDGIWLTELAPLSDPEELPGALLGALGLHGGARLARYGPAAESAGESDATTRLMAALGGREALLVLDNCEHLIEAAADLSAAVLAACPGVRVLATSREPLGITGEVVHPVAPLRVPPERTDLGPADVLGYPAARLFADRAASGASFAVDDANAGDVARICRVLDGIPLAIELAAARLRTLSPAQVADRLGDRFALLTSGDRTADARHRTLRAVVDWSWDMLSDSERLLARRLSVFRGGATLDALQQICTGRLSGSAEFPAGQVVDTLAGLVDKSLVIADQRDGHADRRYHMLETIREYCLRRLAESAEEAAVRRAHAQYFLALAERAEPALRRADQLLWMRILIAENENEHSALRFAIDSGDRDLAVRLVGALGYYWFLRGKHREQRPLAEAVLSLAWPGWHGTGPVSGRRLVVAPQDAWAVACCVLSVIYETWNIDLVRPVLMAAIEAAESDGHQVHPMMALFRPVLAQLDLDFEGSLHLLGSALESSDPWAAALARALRAGMFGNLGRQDEAEAESARAERAFRDLGDRWGIAIASVGRGYAAGLRGDRGTQIATFEEAIRLLDVELSAEEEVPGLLTELAQARMATGDLAAAAADLDRALEFSRRASHDDSYLNAAAGQLARMRGDLPAARAAYERALEILQQRPKAFLHMHAVALAGLARVALGEGGGQEAADLLADALRLAVESRTGPAIADVLETVATLAVTDGQLERAVTLLGAADGLRGAADPAHPDIAAVSRAARAVLKEDDYARCYERGRQLCRDEAVSLGFWR